MTHSSNDSLALSLSRLPTETRAKILGQLSPEETDALKWEWRFWARPNQLPPPGHWSYWLTLAGRGWGKTRTGAQWVIDQVERHGKKRIALVAETAADARDVMVEGESGILACSPPWFRPKYEPSKRRLRWPNGAIATTYTAEKPDQLRGPQHDGAWADEIAKWRYTETWDQLCFGLRLGNDPQCVITTTPKPTPLIKDLVVDPLARVTKGSTHENRANLAKSFLEKILQKYEGTRLGRQELYAEILDDAPGALWKRGQIEALRRSSHPKLVRVVVAVDPSVSSDSPNAATGIVAAGLGDDGHGYVLDDASLEHPTPDEWAKQTVGLYSRLEADRVVAEVNNGGDLVESNIRTINRSISFKQVRATRGKQVRAEPIAALYEQGKIHHVGYLGALEDEQCQWEPGVSTFSPNRVDALVWALTELMLEGKEPGKLLIVKRRD